MHKIVQLEHAHLDLCRHFHATTSGGFPDTRSPTIRSFGGRSSSAKCHACTLEAVLIGSIDPDDNAIADMRTCFSDPEATTFRTTRSKRGITQSGTHYPTCRATPCFHWEQTGRMPLHVVWEDGRRDYPIHWWGNRDTPLAIILTDLRDRGQTMLKKTASESASGQRAAESLESPYWVGLSTLMEYLTQTTWEDGTDRQTSQIKLWVDGGEHKAMLADRENGMVLFHTAGSFHDLLSEIDSQLVSGEADWRKDKFAKIGRKSRK